MAVAAAEKTEKKGASPEVVATPNKQFPEPHVGMIVVWRADRSSEPSPAIVMQLGRRNRMTVHVMQSDSPVFDRRDGVPYIHDDFRDEDMFESGCWGYTDDILKYFA